jgi:hypothetical protein
MRDGMMCNPKPTRTSNVEVKGEEGKSPVPGRLTAVRKSLGTGRGRSRRKAEATGSQMGPMSGARNMDSLLEHLQFPGSGDIPGDV